jgi:hypothetical protein
MALILLYLLGQFVWAALERGLPTQPVYYIASVVEIGLGFLTYKLISFLPRKFTKLKAAKLFSILPLALMTFCLGIPIAMYHSNIEVLKPAGAAWIWYIVSGMTLGLYTTIRKTLSTTEPTPEEQDIEYMSKGLFLFIVVMGSLFLVLILIVFIIFLSLSAC